MSSQLPRDVAAFIGDCLFTLDELEILTAMTGHRDRWWDPRQVGAQLGVPLSSARNLLDHLAALNLLDIGVRGDVRYRFRPGTRALDDIVARVVAAYRFNRGAVASVIASPGPNEGAPARRRVQKNRERAQ